MGLCCPQSSLVKDSSSISYGLSSQTNQLRMVMVRHTLGRRLGHTPYILARKLRWGDLMPAHYLPYCAFWLPFRGWRRGEFVRPEPSTWHSPTHFFCNMAAFTRQLDPA